MELTCAMTMLPLVDCTCVAAGKKYISNICASGEVWWIWLSMWHFIIACLIPEHLYPKAINVTNKGVSEKTSA